MAVVPLDPAQGSRPCRAGCSENTASIPRHGTQPGPCKTHIIVRIAPNAALASLITQP